MQFQGKFLCGSNRGNNSDDLTICSIEQKTRKLTLAGKQSSLGKSPRNFAIDPSGNFLILANQSSNDIFIFKHDLETGLLTPNRLAFVGDNTNMGIIIPEHENLRGICMQNLSKKSLPTCIKQ